MNSKEILTSIHNEMLIGKVNVSKMCRELGINRTHLSNQIHGVKGIKLDRLVNIVEYLGLEITIGFKK